MKMQYVIIEMENGDIMKGPHCRKNTSEPISRSWNIK